MDGQDAEESSLGNAIEVSAPGLVGMLYYLTLLAGRSRDGPAREEDREQGKANQ